MCNYRTKTLAGFLFYLALSTTVCGQTLHHWRFEGSQFLEDVVGGAVLSGTLADQMPLGANGPGAEFPLGFVGGVVNESAVVFDDQSNGLVADTTGVAGSFTIELFTHIEDLFHPRTQSDAVLAAQVTGTGSPSEWGWAFHVEKSDADRQLSLTMSDGTRIESALSGITINEQSDYYIAAAMDLENGLATFYAKDLTNDAPLETDVVSHSLTALNPDSYFQIGEAPNFGFGHVDGVIDEVRFSSGVVPAEGLLVNNVPEPSAAILATIVIVSICSLRGGRRSRRY